MNQETKIKNTEIREIIERYYHYGYIDGNDFKAFKNYSEEITSQYKFWNYALEDAIDEGRNPLVPQIMLASMKTEIEEIEYFNTYRIYSGSITSVYYMNEMLRHMWDLECSGYSNNPFFNFKQLVEMVNAYWHIEEPYKPSNKIAYGWKFSMDKATMQNGYYCKTWRLYMWGCIKNYLIRNGIKFTKEESLKVRKIVGLADIYDTIE